MSMNLELENTSSSQLFIAVLRLAGILWRILEDPLKSHPERLVHDALSRAEEHDERLCLRLSSKFSDGSLAVIVFLMNI
jgi:hypothetical protein